MKEKTKNKLLSNFPSKYREIDVFTPSFDPKRALNSPKCTIYGYAYSANGRDVPADWLSIILGVFPSKCCEIDVFSPVLVPTEH